MQRISVSELLPDDVVLTNEGLVMYTILEVDSTETTFTAEVSFQDSTATSQKFWSDSSAEVNVDRSE